ncbi:MAG: GTP 3',8-cyclase MoaA [Candidatus Nezhaarchaeales archaeon]
MEAFVTLDARGGLMLIDRYNRPVKGLRISVTRKCNLKCIYCHMEGDPKPSRGDELSLDGIVKVVKAAAQLGLTDIKITGGEPLLRPDIVGIIEEVAKVPGIAEVSLTSNGTLLERYASKLKEAGLTRVNVNLCSLKPEVYRFVTGRDMVNDVVRGIDAAVKSGLTPVKVNMVVLKGVNVEEIPDMIRFAKNHNVTLQLIELEDMGKASSFFHKYYVDLSPVEEQLKNISTHFTFRAMHRRLKLLLKEGVVVEVVRPHHNSAFCLNCHRLRMTADGRLKPCLMRDDNYVDLSGLLRSASGVEGLKEQILKAVALREPYYKP